MNTNNRFTLQDQRNISSSISTPFNLLIALTGSGMGGMLGLILTLVLTTMIGAEWTLRLVMAAHATFSFGILGAWVAASFAMDDRDDIALRVSLPITLNGPINSRSASTVAA